MEGELWFANTVLQGGTGGSKKIGKPIKSWIDENKEWPGLRCNPLIRTAEDVVSFNRLSVGCVTTPRRQSGDFAGF